MDPIVIQPVVVVTPALAAAVGWGATRAGLDKAGQVETIEASVTVAVGCGAAVVTIEVVVDDRGDEVVETGLDIVMFLSRSLASLRLSGTKTFPSSSIFSNLILRFHLICRHWQFFCLK